MIAGLIPCRLSNAKRVHLRARVPDNCIRDEEAQDGRCDQMQNQSHATKFVNQRSEYSGRT